jgi:nitroreductase
MQTTEAIQSRYSERTFSREKAISRELIEELLLVAARAPSGLNVQPWQFITVYDEKIREALLPICLNQIQVKEAPCVVVFLADPLSWQAQYDRVLDLALASGSIDEARKGRYRDLANVFFRVEPFGLSGLVKKIAVPIRRLFVPTPRMITSYEQRRAYMRSLTLLCAENFLIAATAHGLATCPMGGFDEGRLKRLLNIPRGVTVPIVIPVGYPRNEEAPVKTARLPLDEILHIDSFNGKS